MNESTFIDRLYYCEITDSLYYCVMDHSDKIKVRYGEEFDQAFEISYKELLKMILTNTLIYIGNVEIDPEEGE